MSDEDDLFLNLKEGYRLRTGSNAYRVDAVLGSGGFGITYKAWDEKLERVVAIKEYYPRDFAGRTAVQTVVPSSKTQADLFAWGKARFLDEARTLAKFDHPGIVGVLDFFEANNTAYLVMQFIDGIPLSDHLKLHPFTEAKARLLLAQLVSALQVVHAAGFLHRDVKPSNIMLHRSSGQPVLIDFGAARHSLGNQTHSVTSMASASFSPKEQYLENAPQTVASEIYSICATVYRAMFQAGPPVAISRDEDDSLRELEAAETAGKVGPAFAEALRKGLAYQQRNRFQSLDDLLAAIEAPADAATTHADQRPGVSETPAPPPLTAAPEASLEIEHGAAPKGKVGSRALRLAAIAGLVGATIAALAIGLPRSGLLPPFAAGTDVKIGLLLPVATPTAPDADAQTTAPASEPAPPPPNPCALGEATACYQAGKLMLALPGQELRASEMLQQACNLKSVEACVSLGNVLLVGRAPIKAEPERALSILLSACDLGSATGCSKAALLLAKPHVANSWRPQRKRAVDLVEKACSLGDKDSCRLSAHQAFGFSKAQFSVEDLRSLALNSVSINVTATGYVVSCDVGSGQGCLDAGLSFESGKATGKPDQLNSSFLYERGCELGNAASCNNLGIDFEKGFGGRKASLDDAARYYRISCLGGDGVGCGNIGWFYTLNPDYKYKNVVEGRRYLDKACSAGVSTACNDLGLGYERGIFPEGRTRTKAAKLFRKACDLGEGWGCSNIAGYYESGLGGLVKSRQMALSYYRKACARGLRNACNQAKRL